MSEKRAKIAVYYHLVILLVILLILSACVPTNENTPVPVQMSMPEQLILPTSTPTTKPIPTITLPPPPPTPVIPEGLRDTEWDLVYLDDKELGEETGFELKIEDGKVVALGECNWLRTHIDEQMPHLIITEAGEFSLGFATQSLVGCDGVEREEAYFLALSAVTTYELADNQLRLSTPEKTDLLIFEKR